MRSLPAGPLTVAVALALSQGCAAAPSPSPSPPSAAHTTLLVAWAVQSDSSVLLAIDPAGAARTTPLPQRPNGTVAGSLDGRLGFVAGAADAPVLWTADGLRSGEPAWQATPLLAPAGSDEPLRWLCLSPGNEPRLAVQSNDTSLFLVESDGGLRALPRPHGLFRPGGCAWLDETRLLVPLDIPNERSGIAFALIGVDDGSTAVFLGGGEDPAVAAGRLAHAARERSRSVVLVRALPVAGQALPDPGVRIAGPGGADLYRAVLSADGSRLALLERDDRSRPLAILVYDLTGGPALILSVDIGTAADAGPIWVGGVPAP